MELCSLLLWLLVTTVTSSKNEKDTVVSSSGCVCKTECLMSYAEPHYDAHFCYVDASQCGKGCNCHQHQEDSLQKSWDFCDPSYSLQDAWSHAPAFTRGAYASQKKADHQLAKAEHLRKSVHKKLAKAKEKEEAVVREDGATVADVAADAAKKAAAQARHQDGEKIKQIEKHAKKVELDQDHLAKKRVQAAEGEAESAWDDLHYELMTAVAFSAAVALCAWSVVACMIPRWRQSSELAETLETSETKVKALEQEKVDLSTQVSSLKNELGDSKNAMSQQVSDLSIQVDQLRHMLSIKQEQERVFEDQACLTESRSSSRRPSSCLSPSFGEGMRNDDALDSFRESCRDDLEALPGLTPLSSAFSGSLSVPEIQCRSDATVPTLLSSMAFSAEQKMKQAVLPPETLVVEQVASVMPPSPASIWRVETSPQRSLTQRTLGLQQGLLAGAAWNKVGDEVWSSQEAERNARFHAVALSRASSRSPSQELLSVDAPISPFARSSATNSVRTPKNVSVVRPLSAGYPVIMRR